MTPAAWRHAPLDALYSGSSRTWAAPRHLLIGMRATISRSLDRIHRSKLIGMDVLIGAG
jgi:aconitase A